MALKKGLNKVENLHVKVSWYLGVSSLDMINHIKPSLSKEPDKIFTHVGTKDKSNNVKDSKNVKMS